MVVFFRVAVAVIPVVAQRMQNDQLFRSGIVHRATHGIEQDVVETGIIGEAAEIQKLRDIGFFGEH